MDLVIPFSHSINKDDELKMSLRTIERNLEGSGHVWIVGDTPLWNLNPVNSTVIPAKDVYNKEPNRNIANKMLIACANNLIPDEFLLVHDDNFITAPCDIDIWPWNQKGTEWKDTLAEKNTKELFGKNIPNFDLHCPHRMTKVGIRLALQHLDWKKPGGYCIKTAYCLTNNVPSNFYWDLKILTEAGIKKLTAGRPFFSCSDESYYPLVHDWLIERFPNNSRYEK